MIIKAPKFTIYFGNNQDAIIKDLDCVATNTPLIAHDKFEVIANKIAVNNLGFLNQTHSADGMIVKDHVPAFDSDGDYLIVAQPNIGIGVMTADCLPIAIYDEKNHVAAMIHAGWRGSISRIAQKAIKEMQQEFGSQFKDLRIFFGPSAKKCCYQVTGDFLAYLESFDYRDQIINKRENTLYFDNPTLNSLQLQELGISESAISKEYNSCTICDHQFYSYRRQAKDAGRQMSIISLLSNN